MRIDRTIGAPNEIERYRSFRERKNDCVNIDRVSLDRLVSAGPVDIILANYEDQVETDFHTHQWHSFHLVVSGAVEEQYADRERAEAAGGLLFYQKNVVHQTNVSRARSKIVHFPIWNVDSTSGNGTTVLDFDLVSEIFFFPMMHMLLEFFETQFCYSKTRRAGVEFNQKFESIEQNWTRILELDPGNLSGDLNMCAKMRGRSRGHFARLFRRSLGCSVGEFRKRSMVSATLRCILQGERSFARLANKIGFSDQSHMGRAVKQTLGMTPGRIVRILEDSLMP